MLAFFRCPRLRVLSCIQADKLLYYSINYSIAHKIEFPERDYSANPAVAHSNHVITKLSREGRINEARNVFDEMCARDVVTWTTVITGYVKCGLMEEARKLFDRVDAKKNVITWTSMVSGYVRLKRISEAERLFEDMPERNVVSWNTMVDGYAQHGMIDKALMLFEKMPARNVVSWNMIITALEQCGRIDKARQLFDMMPTRNVVSWTAMVSGLARNGRIQEAREVFERMPARSVVSWNAMINGYVQNLRLDEAVELFERMPERDMPSWNIMITGYIQNNNLTRGRNLFDQMRRKNVVSWTTMIMGYVQDGQSEEALKIFSYMLADGEVRPNQGTFVCVLGACCDLAGLNEGQQVHQMINKTIYLENENIVSALISMYSKCGDLGTARRMFDDGVTSQRDLVSWNCMIAAYAHHGYGNEAIILFNKMQDFGFKPNDVTYVGLLTACSHAGLVEEGLKFFEELLYNTCIQLREDHYSCLVDLYGRAGRLKDAIDFIKQIGTEVSSSVWGALLAACHVHGDVNLGKLVAKELLEVEPENSGAHLLLSNIYASTGKWSEAKGMRLKMMDKGLKKQPGCSWIEVGNRFHVFIVGDKSHSHRKIIYSLLCDLHAKMKLPGLIPNNVSMPDENFAVT
ncbi:pentatricopeptide repeat-containing protein [Tripterygium wilfordii]|uniref:Pentatricopeptide repeat-containing protein n=1 Tax=Tripterygium wilfordii TaxID=458696 RepID=A0A7J7DRR2_TRIWF|nr:pentatricopeptide repeat-containing protein At2g35030, mitochondrial [Tripterygium wilfordii]KAF5749045.1 pentatricopeptide repeat-containing protein [Tripterygium wilfordii]